MRPAHVTLLFTSDEHGYLRPARNLQSAVIQARQENPEGTMLLSSGDFFEGSADTGILGIQASLDLMGKAGYDVMTVGNHDFDRGPDLAKKWVKDSPAKVLVANVKDSTTGQLLEGSEASHVFEVGGTRFGLIGVTTAETASILPADKQVGLTFESPLETVRAEVEKLKAQGVHTIGLVSHLGLKVDRDMAAQVPELDFILGGHSHDATKEPEKVGKTLIVHPGCFRQSMGRLDLDISPETGQVSQHHFQLLEANSQVEDQGEVGQFIQEKQAIVDAELDKPVASLPFKLSFDPNSLNSNISAVLTQAVLKATDADIALMNVKMVRNSLPQGEVTRKDVFNVLPFDTQIAVTEMTVDDVVKKLDESYRRTGQTGLSDLSPLHLMYDIQSREPYLAKSAPLDPYFKKEPAVPSESNEFWAAIPSDTKLQVATTDYLLSGGLGYFDGQANGIQSGGNVRDVFQQYLEDSY